MYVEDVNNLLMRGWLNRLWKLVFMNFNDSTGCVLFYCTKCLVNQHVNVTNYCYKLILPVFIIKPYIYIDSLWVLSFSEYKLVAFISHMGTSTMVGHYVCHIKKEGRWVIYNDEKVALSEHPPRDLAYLYLYQRLWCRE